VPPFAGTGRPPESVMLCGSLHWCTGQKIILFDTSTESVRQMRSPIVSGRADLFEMDGMLAVYRCNDAATEIDRVNSIGGH
jgi:hypothetical protein